MRSRAAPWGAVVLPLGLKLGARRRLVYRLPGGANMSESKRMENLDSPSSTPVDLLVDLGQIPSFFLCPTQFGHWLFWKGSSVGRSRRCVRLTPGQ